MTYRIGLPVRHEWLPSIVVPRGGCRPSRSPRLRLANDEPDIGNCAVVLTRHLRGLAGVHEDAIRNGS